MYLRISDRNEYLHNNLTCTCVFLSQREVRNACFVTVLRRVPRAPTLVAGTHDGGYPMYQKGHKHPTNHRTPPWTKVEAFVQLTLQSKLGSAMPTDECLSPRATADLKMLAIDRNLDHYCNVQHAFPITIFPSLFYCAQAPWLPSGNGWKRGVDRHHW